MSIFELMATVGGILLIFGSYSLYKGNAFLSIIFYFFADLCWLGMSVAEGKLFGTISILIGISFSLGVFYKMNKGLFHKNLRKKEF